MHVNTILIIESDAVLRDTLAMSVETEKGVVLTAVDEAQALMLLSKLPNHYRVTHVLLNICLPSLKLKELCLTKFNSCPEFITSRPQSLLDLTDLPNSLKSAI